MKLCYLLVILIAAIVLASSACQPASANDKIVLKVKIQGYISRATAEYVNMAVDEASSDERTSALLIVLDTPGGELQATEDVIEALVSSRVPVICYVYPPGGKALSAGTYIMESGDIAAMAPYTIAGAGQPVLGFTPVNESKYVNPLSTRLLALMKMHGRNWSLAQRIVESNLVLDSDEALKNGMIDVVAVNSNDLLAEVDGHHVERLGVTLELRNVKVVEVRNTLRQMALSTLSNPMLSSLLLMIGLLLLIFGLATPGLGAEVIGAIMVVLGLIGVGIDVNLVVVALMVLGAALIAYELSNPGFGISGVGGAVALLLGGLLLVARPFTPSLISPNYISSTLLWVGMTSAAAVGFLVLMVYKAVKAARLKRSYSYDIVGNVGRAIEDIPEGSLGFIVVKGEYWRARPLKDVGSGSRVRVVGREEDGVLRVEPI